MRRCGEVSAKVDLGLGSEVRRCEGLCASEGLQKRISEGWQQAWGILRRSVVFFAPAGPQKQRQAPHVRDVGT